MLLRAITDSTCAGTPSNGCPDGTNCAMCRRDAWLFLQSRAGRGLIEWVDLDPEVVLERLRRMPAGVNVA